MIWVYKMLSWYVAVGVFLEIVLSAQGASTRLGPVIMTYAGSFQGLEVTPPGLEQSVYAFLGIPYGKPPTGQMRFSKPLAADFILGVYNATTKPSTCFQLDSDFALPWADTKSTQSEDCLYLNVWTPVLMGESKPVMLWLHGGGFTSGSSALDIYDGQVLSALGQVVVVTINYRLGPFGFLNTLTDDAPGNAALYDQLLALKWVQNNIGFFGGDPKRVTLFGESAGAMCTSLLSLSPLSRGLFHRVILESGSSYYLPGTSPTAGVESGNLLASLVGCANDTFTLFTNPKEVVSCLRSVPASELTKTYYKQHGSQVEKVVIYFRPQFWDEVIPKHPIDIFLSKNYSTYDMFAGVCELEGSSLLAYFFPDIYKQYAEGKQVLNKTLATTALNELFKSIGLKNTQKAIDFYLKDIGDDQQSLLNAVFYGIGDPVITCPTVYVSDRYAEKGTPVMFYRFDHTPSTSPWPEAMGAAHFEEVQFVFGLPVRYSERYQSEEKALSEYMIRIWTDFAKAEDLTLKNGTKWPNYSRSKQEFATFQTGQQQSIRSSERKEACEFWRPYFDA